MDKVYVIDDHPMVLEYIRILLKKISNNFFIENFTAPFEALHILSKETDPTLVILDLHMPGMTGFELISFLQKKSNLKFLVLTADEDPEMEVLCIKKGASGFVQKSTSPELLLWAIQKILAGETFFSHAAQSNVDSQPLPLNKNRLSHKEVTVAELIVAGKTYAAISEILHISKKTIATHKHHIFKKLGIKTIPELMKKLK